MKPAILKFETLPDICKAFGYWSVDTALEARQILVELGIWQYCEKHAGGFTISVSLHDVEKKPEPVETEPRVYYTAPPSVMGGGCKIHRGAPSTYCNARGGAQARVIPIESAKRSDPASWCKKCWPCGKPSDEELEKIYADWQAWRDYERRQQAARRAARLADQQAEKVPA